MNPSKERGSDGSLYRRTARQASAHAASTDVLQRAGRDTAHHSSRLLTLQPDADKFTQLSPRRSGVSPGACQRSPGMAVILWGYQMTYEALQNYDAKGVVIGIYGRYMSPDGPK